MIKQFVEDSVCEACAERDNIISIKICIKI